MKSARTGWLVVVAQGCLVALLSPAGLGRLTAQEAPAKAPAAKTISLFDGKTLAGWKVSDFAGHGDVEVEDGEIILQMGESLTGITATEAPPTMDFELSLDAQRVVGDDFFCGLTFPVGKSPCSLIVGGWGGATVGLSSINGADASENETTTFQSFVKKQWYHIRLRVTKPRIQAWIDKEKVVDLETKDREFSIRSEVEESKPLGISAWCTTAALKNIQLRRLGAVDLQAPVSK
jgi:hypothetical protein